LATAPTKVRSKAMQLSFSSRRYWPLATPNEGNSRAQICPRLGGQCCLDQRTDILRSNL
jgi:hypothetical protein